MNKDEFEGVWKQIHGHVREWWGKLTDNDVEKVGGQYEQLIGVLQERYGYSREAAIAEFNQRITAYKEARKQIPLIPPNHGIIV